MYLVKKKLIKILDFSERIYSYIYRKIKKFNAKYFSFRRRFFLKKITLKFVEFRKLINKKEFFYFNQILIPRSNKKLKPVFINKSQKSKINKYLNTTSPYSQKDIMLSKINNAYIYGGIELIEKNNISFISDFFNPKSHISADEISKNIFFSSNRESLYLFSKHNFELNKNFFIIDKALYLYSACGKNYFHWLVEIAPKLAIYCKFFNEKITLLVNHDLHPNIRRLIKILSNNSNIIELKPNNKYLIKELNYISGVTNLPFDFLKTYKSNNFRINKRIQIYYNSDGLNIVKENFKKSIKLTNSKSPRKVYLLREFDSKRKITNIKELEKQLRMMNFEFINPLNYSIDIMADKLKDTEIIVLQGGAAVANSIFLRKPAKVIVMAASSKIILYHTLTNLISILGHKIYLVFGEISQNRKNYFPNKNPHVNFEIDINQLIMIIKSIKDF